MTPAPSDARQKLLKATERLIYRGGILATGMDAIVRESGVSRKTIYSHFPSKEALVAHVLQERDARWMDWFIRATSRAKSPAARLLSAFDALDEWFHSEDFNGCAFINAAGEIGDANDPIRVIAHEHKARLRDYLRGIAAELPATYPDRLASELLILIDGAITVAKVMGHKSAAREAQQLAQRLLSL
jgi:AcrR family transcriptional regulator